MTQIRKIRPDRRFVGRIPLGGDLLDELTKVCASEEISLGRVTALGAVKRARLACYHQEDREYRDILLDEPLEIASLVGNVSLKDGEPFVHAHITLSDMEGKTYGGHLAAGTVVFACEFFLEAFGSRELRRSFDEETGLFLWDMGGRWKGGAP